MPRSVQEQWCHLQPDRPTGALRVDFRSFWKFSGKICWLLRFARCIVMCKVEWNIGLRRCSEKMSSLKGPTKKKTVYGCSSSPLTQNNFLKYLPDLKSNKKCLSSVLYFFSFPPASEARRKVANLIGRKNSHTSVYGVKEFVRLSVCLSVVIFDPNYLRTGWTEWAKKI